MTNVTAKKMYKFPSIELLHNLVKTLTFQYPEESKCCLPTLTFRVTPKLHGTCSGVVYNALTKEVYALSRERVITPEDDNFGFARWVKEKESEWLKFFQKVYAEDSANTYILWGEWAGKGINDNTAIIQLPKAFYVFEAAVEIEDVLAYTPVPSTENQLFFSIYDWEMPELTADFANSESLLSFQTTLNTITKSVEDECPVAKYFGISGIGEGIVLRSYLLYEGEPYRLKSKGDKHSVVKQKVPNSIDPELLATRQEFANKFVTEARIKQALFTLNLDNDLKNIGQVIKWTVDDIAKESKAEVESMNTTFKDLQSEVVNKIKEVFKTLPVV